MIDTIKLGIPLTKTQHAKIQKQLSQNDDWQWIKIKLSTGEMACVRSKGLADTDLHSYHREIKFDVDTNFHEGDTYLTFEFSIPKFWIGHNVHLIYDWITPLEHFRRILQKQLHCRFPVLDEWKVRRVDVCYAWKLSTQDYAKQVLNSMKGMKFPHKTPIIYPDAILFSGKTYSVKFYLKLPEFINHDLKEMVKAKYNYEWINWIEERASGVLRYEATLRRKYLKRQNIDTVKDLRNEKIIFEWTSKFKELNTHIEDYKSFTLIFSISYILLHHIRINGGFNSEGKTLMEQLPHYGTSKAVPLVNGKIYEAPEGVLKLSNGLKILHRGGGFIYRTETIPEQFLNLLLDKFIGKNRTMDNADITRLKLKQKYKRNKAAHLYALWLYVQRHGVAEAIEEFGKNSFYNSRKAIYDAGCNFATPVESTVFDADKFQKFALTLNSAYVVNKEDDNRDSCNLINLISANNN